MKIRRDSQYQQKEVLDWAAHLEHLQAVLKEFDPSDAPNEITFIRYFQEGLRPSIRAQLDHRGRDLDGWEEVVEKAGDAKTKANLQLPFYVRDIDTKCPKGHRPSSKNKETTESLRVRPPRTKTRPSPRTPPTPLISSSLRPRLPKKTSSVAGEAMEEAIQPPESMLLR